ncbi:MAG TPA: serine--tRNA ligase [Bacteroidetes bacterium]|nr:serine--tRNA ligase [Bacteroidota bacterium]
MLTLKRIRENPEEVIKRLKIKNFDASDLIRQVLEADTERRRIQTETDAKQAELNLISKEIGVLFKQQKTEEANRAKQDVATLKEDIKQLNQKLHLIENKLNELLVLIPNTPHPSVPTGKENTDNVEVRHGGIIPELDDKALPHWELGKKYGLIDFDLGNKLTGAGFPVFTGKGAKLVRALIGFFLDEAEKAGYQEVLPPLMVNEASAYGTGQLPDKEGQMYQLSTDPYYLIPTAEVPVTNIYRDIILDAGGLPVKNTAYTPCFRREAGSYGKDVRGLNRVHQFDKVEIVQIQHPDRSYDTLEEMVSHVEQLLVKLGLPYRIMQLCGGDLSFTSALTYDFEVYAAAQKKWLEVSSVSNFESYQANRLKLRYREPGSKKTQLAHTLNGSALALPRIIAALLENYQTPDGIKIPEALVPYTHYETIP